MKFRAFISVDIGANPEFNKLEILLDQTSANLKLVQPENLHVTLKFLGDINKDLIDPITTSMQRSIIGTPPFTLKFRGLGAFPNRNYIKVIWVGIENHEPLQNIAKKLDNELKHQGFKPEKRGFSAHLTLARVKSRRGKDELNKIINNFSKHKFGEILTDCIRLKKSELTPEGPIYTTIKEIKFE
jgi:2'-5' RNA ligase